MYINKNAINQNNGNNDKSKFSTKKNFLKHPFLNISANQVYGKYQVNQL